MTSAAKISMSATTDSMSPPIGAQVEVNWMMRESRGDPRVRGPDWCCRVTPMSRCVGASNAPTSLAAAVLTRYSRRMTGPSWTDQWPHAQPAGHGGERRKHGPGVMVRSVGSRKQTVRRIVTDEAGVKAGAISRLPERSHVINAQVQRISLDAEFHESPFSCCRPRARASSIVSAGYGLSRSASSREISSAWTPATSSATLVISSS